MHICSLVSIRKITKFLVSFFRQASKAATHLLERKTS
ncbi:MAG: hypothetical protein ACI9DJ_001957 [Algoriphagus sp.]